MPQNLPDLAVGMIFFTSLIILSIIGGGLLQGSAKVRNHKALKSLAPIVRGVVESDHQSAWMDGEYQGHRVHIRMTPGRNIAYASDESIKINSFEIFLLNTPGPNSWEIAYTGILRKQWTVKASDETIQRKLAQSNLVPRMKKVPRRPSLRYEEQDRRLHLQADVQPRRAPKPAQFRDLLDLVVYAVDVNATVNPPKP